MSKPFKNILREWHTFQEHGDLRIRGTAMMDQPSIGAERGKVLITSPLVRIYIDEEKRRVLETKNSLYILEDGEA